MSAHDALWLIRSDATGHPGNGGFQHWVRRTDNPRPALVNQMTAGGGIPNDDCAPADLLSRQRDDGHNPPMRTLERLCATSGTGTSLPNLMHALASLGYHAHEWNGPAIIGYLMNPAWGGLISPAMNGPYLAAYTGTAVIIDTPGAWETAPAPTPPPTPQENEMDTRYIPAWNGQQHALQVDANGNLTHHWYGGAGWLVEMLAVGLRPFGSVDWAIAGGQLQVWSQRPGSTLFHAYQLDGQGIWHTEEIA